MKIDRYELAARHKKGERGSKLHHREAGTAARSSVIVIATITTSSTWASVTDAREGTEGNARGTEISCNYERKETHPL